MSRHHSTTANVIQMRVDANRTKGNAYRTLEEALAAAGPYSHADIIIATGTYELPSTLSIQGTVKAIVRGDVDGVPIFTSNEATINISVSNDAALEFHGLAFQSMNPLYPAVLITSGKPLFHKCEVQSMQVDYDGHPTIDHCVFINGPSNGLTISGTGSGDVKNTEFRGAQLYNCVLDSASSPTVTGCHFFESGKGSLLISGSNSQPVVSSCIFQDTAISDEGREAIAAASQGIVYVEGTDAPRAAIVIANFANPVLDGNTVFSSVACGIAVFGSNFTPHRLLDSAVATGMFVQKPTRSQSKGKKKGTKAPPALPLLAAVPSTSASGPVTRLPRLGSMASPLGAPGSATTAASAFLQATMVDESQKTAAADALPQGVLRISMDYFPTTAAPSGCGAQEPATKEPSVASPLKGGTSRFVPPPSRMTKNVLRDNASFGVFVSGFDAQACFADLDLTRNDSGGCMVERGGELLLHHCTINQHRSAGATARDALSRIALTNCNVTENSVGVLSISGGELSCSESTVIEDCGCAMHVKDSAIISADVTNILRCNIGVKAEDSGVGIIQHCYLESNGIGYSSLQHGEVQFLSTTFRRNGVAVEGHHGGRGLLSKCSVTDSTGSAQIILSDRGNITFIQTDVKSSPSIAVFCKANALGSFLSCNFFGIKNQEMIRLEKMSDPHFESCSFTGSDGNIIVCHEHSAGTFVNCEILNACRAGIVVKKNAEPTIRGNTIKNNALGVELAGGSQAIVEKNNISNSNVANIKTQGDVSIIASSTISKNVIVNSEFGVMCVEGCTSQISRNVIHTCLFGIHSGEESSIVVAGNEILLNQVGVVVQGEATEGFYFGNVIRENAICGMWVQAGCKPTVMDNIFMAHFRGSSKSQSAMDRKKSPDDLLFVPPSQAANAPPSSPIALRLEDNCYGSFAGNRFLFNFIAVQAHPATFATLLHNFFADNVCGVLCRDDKKRSVLEQSQSMLKAGLGRSSVLNTSLGSDRGASSTSTIPSPASGSSSPRAQTKDAVKAVANGPPELGGERYLSEPLEPLFEGLPPLKPLRKRRKSDTSPNSKRDDNSSSGEEDADVTMVTDVEQFNPIGNRVHKKPAGDEGAATVTAANNNVVEAVKFAVHAISSTVKKCSPLLPQELEVTAEEQAEDEAAGLIVASCTFISNHTGISTSGRVCLEVDSCTFSHNKATAFRSRSDAALHQVTYCLFHRNGPQNALLEGEVFDGPADDESSPLEGSAPVAPRADLPLRVFEGCVFHGANSRVAVLRRATNVKISECIFIAAGIVSKHQSVPLVTQCSFIGHLGLPAKLFSCKNKENIEYLTDLQGIELYQSNTGFSRSGKLPISFDSFAGTRAVTCCANGAGTFERCTITFFQHGFVVDGTSTALEVRNVFVGRCRDAGVLIGRNGLAGVIVRCVIARNFGAGILSDGKCDGGHFKHCSLVDHSSQVLPRSMDIKDPLVIAAYHEQQDSLFLPDVHTDAPFNGSEKSPHAATVDRHQPTYTCPASEGSGVGVRVLATGTVRLDGCYIVRSAIANVIVEGKMPSTFSDCVVRDGEGYGMVLHFGANVTVENSFILRCFYCGILALETSKCRVEGTIFEDNTIGFLSNRDTATELLKCVYSGNRVAGVRAVNGSSLLVAESQFQDNGGGIDVQESPVTIRKNTIEHSSHCGVVISGHTATHLEPLIVDSLVRKNGICGVMLRNAGKCSVTRSLIHGNNSGVVARTQSILTLTESTMSDNIVALVAEWGCLGVVERNLFRQNHERSIVCRTLSNIHVRHNYFVSDAPVAVLMEGRSVFAHNTFRTPKSNCFIIAQGGNPLIAYTKFSLLHGTTTDTIHAKLLEERDVDKLKTLDEIAVTDSSFKVDGSALDQLQGRKGSMRRDLFAFVMPTEASAAASLVVSQPPSQQPTRPPSAEVAIAAGDNGKQADATIEVKLSPKIDEQFAPSAFPLVVEPSRRRASVSVHRPSVIGTRKRSYTSSLLHADGHSSNASDVLLAGVPTPRSAKAASMTQSRKHAAQLDMPPSEADLLEEEEDADVTPGGDLPATPEGGAGRRTSSESSNCTPKLSDDPNRPRKLSLSALRRRSSAALPTGPTGLATPHSTTNRRISSYRQNLADDPEAMTGFSSRQKPRNQLERDLANTVAMGGTEFAEHLQVPICVEAGGFGLITNCIFAHNQPCSILCDGPSARPVVEHCLFYDHRICSIVVTASASVHIRSCIFLRNANAIQFFHALGRKTIIENCAFRLNLSSVECIEGDCGRVTTCHFADDASSILACSGSSVKVDGCNFSRCDQALLGEPNSILLVDVVHLWGCIDGVTLQSDENYSGRNTTPHCDATSTEVLRNLMVTNCVHGIRIGNRRDTQLQRSEVHHCSEVGVHISAPEDQNDIDAGGVPVSIVLSDVKVTACKVGMLVDGDTSPMIGSTSIEFCGVGMHCIDGASPSVMHVKIKHSIRGLHVEKGSFGIYRYMEVVNCDSGVTLSSGLEDIPTFSRCNVFDCKIVGFHFLKGAGGTVMDSTVFECGVCIMFDEGSYTAVSHVVSSHPSKNIDKTNDCLRIGKFAVPRLGDDITLNYDSSPAMYGHTKKMRAVDYSKAKLEHDTLLQVTVEHDVEERDRMLSLLNVFLGHFKMHMNRMSTLPVHVVEANSAQSFGSADTWSPSHGSGVTPQSSQRFSITPSSAAALKSNSSFGGPPSSYALEPSLTRASIRLFPEILSELIAQLARRDGGVSSGATQVSPRTSLASSPSNQSGQVSLLLLTYERIVAALSALLPGPNTVPLVNQTVEKGEVALKEVEFVAAVIKGASKGEVASSSDASPTLNGVLQRCPPPLVPESTLQPTSVVLLPPEGFQLRHHRTMQEISDLVRQRLPFEISEPKEGPAKVQRTPRSRSQSERKSTMTSAIIGLSSESFSSDDDTEEHPLGTRRRVPATAHLPPRAVGIFSADEIKSMDDSTANTEDEDNSSEYSRHRTNKHSVVGNGLMHILPRLEVDQFQQPDPYPWEIVQIRQHNMTIDEIRKGVRVFPPPMLTMHCLERPQYDKFQYSSQVYEALAPIAKVHNSIYADQLLLAFHTADHRKAERLTSEDVTQFLEKVVLSFEGDEAEELAVEVSTRSNALTCGSEESSTESRRLSLSSGATTSFQTTPQPNALEISSPGQAPVITPSRTPPTASPQMTAFSLIPMVKKKLNKKRSHSAKGHGEKGGAFGEGALVEGISLDTAEERMQPRYATLKKFVHMQFAELFGKDSRLGTIDITEFNKLVTATFRGVLGTYLKLYFSWMWRLEPVKDEEDDGAPKGGTAGLGKAIRRYKSTRK